MWEYHSCMSKELPPSRTAEQFVVRFPDGMRDRIAEAAKQNNRSMNAEIVARLQGSFADHVAPAAATMGELRDGLLAEIKSLLDEYKTGQR